MSSRIRLAVCAFMAALVSSTGLPGTASDGISLQVDRSATPGALSLSWTGGLQPYLVFRSQEPAAVVTATTRIAGTAGTSLEVPEDVTTEDYFLVVTVDRDSTVSTTSSCLTAGSGAQSAIEVDLLDSLGNTLPGSTVMMATDQGTLGSVEATGGVYRAVLSPPPAAAGPATVSITADGTPLNTTPSVTIDTGLDTVAGGAGGCPADGNLRVRVVDEVGLPILGANVMVGQQESLDLFQTTPGGSSDGDNVALSDPDGYAEFADFGDNLDGPQVVTAAASGRRYVTLLDVDAADVVLPLGLVEPAPPEAVFTGDVTNVPAPANDPIELAVMLPDFSIDQILSFSAADLLADNECYSAGGAAGDSALPGNVYIPAQCAVQIIFCLQSLPEHPYTSVALPYGDRQLLALRGGVPLSALSSGDFNQVLNSLSTNGIGVVGQTASVPGPTALNLPITNGVNANLDCGIDNAPTNSDVFCVGAGDWDSATDPTLPPGAGRLFLTGFRVGDATDQTELFFISGVTTVVDTGDFANIDYLGAAVAQYNDPLKPGIPPGTVDGTSAILERSGTAFDGSGGTLVFSDFFPVRTLGRVNRDFTLSVLPGSPHPAPHLTRVTLDRVVSEDYTACVAADSSRTLRFTLWEVFLPGATSDWQLPTPPVGWPRQAAGGDLAGLIDPAVTPENDLLEYVGATFHLGTLPGFDYDQFQLPDLTRHATHVTRNEVGY